MFRFSANEQLLADWIQWQSHSEGLFPADKGWRLRFQLQSSHRDSPAFFFFEAQNDDEKLCLVPVITSTCMETLTALKASLKPTDTLVLLCGESAADQVSLCIVRSHLPKSTLLLALGEESMETYLGEWENSRLEFRLSKQQTRAWEIPHQVPLNPALLEDEALLSRCFLELFSHLTQQWLQGEERVPFEGLLQRALPLYSQLPKGDRKRVSSLILNQMQQLIHGPLKDWVTLDSFQKKRQSEPVIGIKFLSPPKGRGAVIKELRKQSQAIHSVGSQLLQTSYYDFEVNSF